MSSKPNLTPQAIVAWFREKAREFDIIADRVEATFLQGQSLNGFHLPTPNGDHLPARTSVTVEDIKSALAEKKGRAKHVAKRLGVSTEAVLAVIAEEPDRIRVLERGWLEVVSG